MNAGAALVAILVLAMLGEWLTERFFGKWITGETMVYLSAGVGIILCILFRVDGLALLGLPEPMYNPWTGQIVTGLIVGAGSGAVHKFFGQQVVVEPDPFDDDDIPHG